MSLGPWGTELTEMMGARSARGRTRWQRENEKEERAGKMPYTMNQTIESKRWSVLDLPASFANK
jgi:hypothetical protein